MPLKAGDKAPDFTLKSHTLDQVSLSDYKDKSNVVLLFFPLVNSSVCEKELCSFRDGLSQYNEMDAQVLAVSVDSHFAQQLWADKHNFNFPLLTDFNKEVCQKYEAYHDIFVPGKLDYNGVAKRSAFVIDKSGIIKYAEVLDNPGDEPNYDAVKETLKSL